MQNKSFFLKLVIFVAVISGVLIAALMLEKITGLAYEFWLESVCLTHISLNVSERILSGKKKH